MIKVCKKNKTLKAKIFFHNGKRYDNLVIAEYVDDEKYLIKNVLKKGCSILYTIMEKG